MAEQRKREAANSESSVVKVKTRGQVAAANGETSKPSSLKTLTTRASRGQAVAANQETAGPSGLNTAKTRGGRSHLTVHKPSHVL